jgi:hypothetical protein
MSYQGRSHRCDVSRRLEWRDVKTYKQYADMPYLELHNELRRMLQQAQRLSIWFNAEERLNLLPALQAMHDMVAQPGRRTDRRESTDPTWEDECRSLGITPELVRQWKRRTQADTDIRHLLGEEPSRPGERGAASNAQAVQHLQAICTAVLRGDDLKAERLAAAFAERYGF